MLSDFPRLLVLSNECISQGGSNGRTMRNFLIGWDKERLAQFCLRLENPDYEICDNYFCVTDAQALDAFKGKKSSSENTSSSQAASNQTARKRNSIISYARDIVWNSGRWKSDAYKKWLSDFSPEIVLLQAGDSAFMYKLAVQIKKQFNIPLVLFNSEGYFFKGFDYFRSHGAAHLFYPIYHAHFKRWFKRAIKCTDFSIYANFGLKMAYDKKFGKPSDVIYTATELSPEKAESHDGFVTSYLGNLGVGRHVQLIEIAETLQSISPDLYLDVYGSADEQVKKEFETCRGIRYQGLVPYEEVKRIMLSSDLLVHVENFSDFYRKDSVYAFSTKIADTLASGTPFLLYAPDDIECYKYLHENKAAFTVSKKEELYTTLMTIIDNPSVRNQYLENSLRLARENHNPEKNTSHFQKIIINAVTKK